MSKIYLIKNRMKSRRRREQRISNLVDFLLLQHRAQEKRETKETRRLLKIRSMVQAVLEKKIL
jgi:hypothetical protein